MAATLAAGITDPPPSWWVFSTVTRSATCTSYGSAASAAATCSASSSSPGRRPGTRRNAIPDMAAADAASVPPTCALASHTTNRPGRTNACSAIWLHRVPVGR